MRFYRMLATRNPALLATRIRCKGYLIQLGISAALMDSQDAPQEPEQIPMALAHRTRFRPIFAFCPSAPGVVTKRPLSKRPRHSLLTGYPSRYLLF